MHGRITEEHACGTILYVVVIYVSFLSLGDDISLGIYHITNAPLLYVCVGGGGVR